MSRPVTVGLRSSSTAPYGLDVPVPVSITRVAVRPAVVGRPVPTWFSPVLAPEPDDTYSWPPWMVTHRMLLFVVLTEFEVVAPSVAKRTPPALPPSQNREPSSVTADRTLSPEKASVSAVVVSMTPLPSTRATTRFTAADVELATPAVVRAAS